MKKNVLFALICASVFGFAFSSCSSDEGNIVDESKTRASAVSGDNGRDTLFILITSLMSMTSMV